MGDKGTSGMNKRGQEGLTLTTLLLIILGIVAVVVVILFFTGFFSKLNNATNNLPSDLQAAVSACELAGSSGSSADYCSKFRKVTINGVEQYQSCNSIAMKPYLTDSTKSLQGGCTNPIGETAATAYCTSQKLKEKTIIEGLSAGCPVFNANNVAPPSTK